MLSKINPKKWWAEVLGSVVAEAKEEEVWDFRTDIVADFSKTI